MKLLIRSIVLSIVFMVIAIPAFGGNLTGDFLVYRTGQPVSDPNLATNRYHIIGEYHGGNDIYLAVDQQLEDAGVLQMGDRVIYPELIASVPVTIYFFHLTGTNNVISFNTYYVVDKPIYVDSFSTLDYTDLSVYKRITWFYYDTEYLSYLALLVSRVVECIPNFNCD